MIELRPYQSRVLDQLWNWFEQNHGGHPLVEACVGAGKSILIGHLCFRAITLFPGTRILMVVASRELCAQNLEKLLRIWPQAPAGVHSAGLGRKDLGRDIIFATIGSVAKKAHLLGRIDLLLVDEAHNINPAAQGMYRTLIRDLHRYNPSMRVIGWTGTAYRGDGIWLTDAEEQLFTDVAARVTMRELLDAGFLSPLRTAPVEQILQASGVRVHGGDYVVSDLARRIDQADLVDRCADELVRLGADRKRWLIYGVTVAHAQHIAAALTERGIACRVVSAETPRAERDEAIRMFRSGLLRALVNVAVLTTGFDVPEVDLIGLMRNTRSPVLYVQIAGRGMRLAEGKADCLWLDFTDTTALLGPVDQVRGRKRSVRKDSAGMPTKVCDSCGARAQIHVHACACCGAEFPVEEHEPHRATVSAAEILSGGPKIERYDVTDVRYRRHEKIGSRPSMRVDYYAGLRCVASEWICVEHEGYALEKARTWWGRRSANAMPENVFDATMAAGSLRKPAAITVNESGKFPEIVGVEWDESNRFDRAA